VKNNLVYVSLTILLNVVTSYSNCIRRRLAHKNLMQWIHELNLFLYNQVR